MEPGDLKKSGLLFAFVIAVALVFFCWPWIYLMASMVEHTICEGKRPTDFEIIESFKSNRSDFLSLIEMTQKDQIEIGEYKIGKFTRDRPFLNIGSTNWRGSDENSILKDYNLTSTRYKKYLSLLKKCGVKQVKPEPNGAVKFYFQHFLTIDYAAYTALLYSPSGPPQKLKLNPSTDNELNAYAVVEDKWYLTTSQSP